MSLRDLSPDDLEAITELDAICFPAGTAFPRETFAECLDSPDCQCFGAEQAGKIIAFAVLFFSGPRAAQIITIDVHPDYRRQGLATLLMAEIEKRAKKEGVVRIVLQVAPDNDPALALYQKWGFAIKSVLRDYYGPRKNAYLMDKTFESPEGRRRLFS